jgi:hypothetical protein
VLCSGASSVIVVSTYALPFGFCLKRPDADLRLVPGDELRLSLRESFIRTGWSSTGHVREVVDGEVRVVRVESTGIASCLPCALRVPCEI